MRSTLDEESNWERAKVLIEEAASRGAEWVGTPENTNYLGLQTELVRRAEALDGPTCDRFSRLAKRLRIHLLLGSFSELSKDPKRCYNTSVLFGPDAERLAVYRKIHLLDATISDTRIEESKTVVPGVRPVIAESEVGVFGLSISHDLRFPELYWRLSRGGAELLTVPSGSIWPADPNHWDVLLRARAIENQAFVLAPAQWGTRTDHVPSKERARAKIVAPSGRVIAEAEDGPGIAIADLDLRQLRRLRVEAPIVDELDFGPFVPPETP